MNNNIIMYFTDVLTFIVDLNSELYQCLFIRVFCSKRKLVFQVRSLLNHYFGFFLYFSNGICSVTVFNTFRIDSIMIKINLFVFQYYNLFRKIIILTKFSHKIEK